MMSILGNMNWQDLVVVIALLASLTYLFRRFRISFSKEGDCSAGCGCASSEIKKNLEKR